ncbi:UNVERIFIED_CONTAM: hypothetical protein PYX00_009631 [Menopon gallinae]|uniref:Mitochondrial basic amino acids transporter n=1 Tax=Menopon gallinae TaxID=328185 RepID=A0AAW2HC61_9NEOP
MLLPSPTIFPGCAGIIVGHPLDTVKVRLQTQDNRKPIYRGTLHCFMSVIRNESVVGLYKGLSSPMVGVAAINAIVFGMYGYIQRRMSDPTSLSSIFIAGAAAGVVQSFICSPMELVKSHLQIHTDRALQSPVKCLSRIYKKDGYRGVFKGLNITIVREGIGFGVYFAVYEWMTRGDKEKVSTFLMLMAGGTSGALSWLSVYPLDVVKSRIQVDGKKLYKNSFDCFFKTARQEGVVCLFRGLSPTLVRAFPTNATTWTVLTWITRLADPNRGKEEYEVSPQFKERRKMEDLPFHFKAS